MKIKKAIKKIKLIDMLLLRRSERIRKKNFYSFYNVGRYSYAISPELIRPDTQIGNFCSIASGVQIGPGHHPIHYLTTSPFAYHYRGSDANVHVRDITHEEVNCNPCILEDDVWIGTNATILQGVHIGRGAVIGANSLVNKDVESYSVVGGVPARVIKKRFDDDIIKRIEESSWWDYPDDLLVDLPLYNVQDSLSIFEARKKRKRELGKECCFIVTSCIAIARENLTDSDLQWEDIVERRLEQTKCTIASIKKRCPNAIIILVDDGCRDYCNSISGLVDDYYYLGKSRTIRIASRKNKGLGEVLMIRYVLKNHNFSSKLIFKISGRYVLTDEFDLAKFDFTRYNFLNYDCEGRVISGLGKYRKGSHSTRLYAVPVNKIESYKTALIRTFLRLVLRKGGIEWELPKYLRGEFFYHKKLGIEGYVALSDTALHE